MKNQVLVGYRVFKKNQVRVDLVSSPRKNVPENTFITSEVIHRVKGLKYVSSTTPNFPWPQNFQHFFHVLSFKSINIVFETGKYQYATLLGRVLRSKYLYSRVNPKYPFQPYYRCDEIYMYIIALAYFPRFARQGSNSNACNIRLLK